MDKEEFCNHISIIQSNTGIDYNKCDLSLKKLRKVFPSDENGFSAIDHYIFDLSFGKPTLDSEYETPEMIWDKLNNN